VEQGGPNDTNRTRKQRELKSRLSCYPKPDSMLRGNYTARIDSKGRLKVPTLFRRYVEEKYGSAVYLTSLTGECVRIYPMQEWEAIEQRLSLLPSMDPARRKFLDRTNYYGQQSSMDTQGRVLIHPLLRKSAAVVGDVAVLGYLSYLEVWELDKFQQRLLSDPYSEEDEAAIARLGI
jgi:MraZ protein